MNVELVKRIAWIGAGALLGGLVGYQFGKLVVRTLEDLEDESNTDDEGPYELPEELRKKLVARRKEWIREVGENRVDAGILDLHTDIVPRDYNSFSKTKKEELEELASKYKTEDPNISIIFLESFSVDDPEFTKETVMFYAGDSVFSNQKDEKIESPESIFGPNVHLHFGEKSEDEDVVYVANLTKKIKYEIIRIHDSYSSAILGIEPPKQKPRRKHVKKVIEPPEDEEE